MVLRERARAFARDRVTSLPVAINRVAMALNRDPAFVFGRGYAAHRARLRAESHFHDNVPQLLASVNRAIAHVPYYRARYGGRTIGSLREFERSIGFLDRDVIMAHKDALWDPRSDRDAYETCSTGGTSGRPLSFLAPKDRYVVELATMHSLWERAGYRFDVRAVIRNHRLPPGRDYQVNPVTREVIFDGFELTDGRFATICESIERLGIRFVHCYPSTAYELGRFMERRGGPPSSLRAFLAGSETVFDHHRELIERHLGIRLYSWYGHSEKLVLAGYCAHTTDYHVEPTYGYCELVDADGRVIRDRGGVGEIVGTSFHNPGMPFLRFRTGDLAEYAGDHCAACGRRTMLLRRIRGRWQGDRVYRRDGSFVTTTALNLHGTLLDVVDGIQYVQERRGELTVVVVRAPGFGDHHAASLISHFEAVLGSGVDVRLECVERLRRLPNGKFVQLLSSLR